MLLGNTSIINKLPVSHLGHAYVALNIEDLELFGKGHFSKYAGFPNGATTNSCVLPRTTGGLAALVRCTSEATLNINLMTPNSLTNTSSCTGGLAAVADRTGLSTGLSTITGDLTGVVYGTGSLSGSIFIGNLSLGFLEFPPEGSAFPTAASIAEAVWANSTRDLTVGAPGTTVSLTEIANAVWTRTNRTTTDPEVVVPPVPTAQEVANAVWASTVKKLSAEGNVDIAKAMAKIGYDTDVLNSQLIQLDENGVEICRFDCFGDQGLPTLVNIKKIVRHVPV